MELYLKYCNCQPLPLFSPQYLKATLSSRDPELLLALISLAARFSPEFPVGMSQGSAEEAQRLVMLRVSQGVVELSTLQTLCMLSLREFNRKSNNSDAGIVTHSWQMAIRQRQASTVLLRQVLLKQLVSLRNHQAEDQVTLLTSVGGAIGQSYCSSVFMATHLAHSHS